MAAACPLPVSDDDDDTVIQSSLLGDIYALLSSKLKSMKIPCDIVLNDDIINITFNRDYIYRMGIREHPDDDVMMLNEIPVELMLLTLHIHFIDGDIKIGFSLLKKGFQNMSIPINTPSNATADEIYQFCMSLFKFP